MDVGTFGTTRKFGSVAIRKICAGGRLVTSAWDSCASHNFISTRLAAELIAKGSSWRRCELPVKQGVIQAGASRVQLLVHLDIIHHGRHVSLPDELFMFGTWEQT